MKIRCFITAFLVLFATTAMAGPNMEENCIRYFLPLQRSILTSPLCTLGIDSSCARIRKVEFNACYFPHNADTLTVTNLGTVYTPPYKIIWNMSEIPNQLFFGLGFIIQVTFANGDMTGIKREGIFLAHKKQKNNEPVKVHYDYSSAKIIKSDLITIQSKRLDLSATAQFFWNEQELTGRIKVQDKLFKSSFDSVTLSKIGVEVLIDPSQKKRAYPGEEVMKFIVPLAGKPSLITYKPVFSDSGTFSINQIPARFDYPYSVSMHDGTGFTITFSVPRFLLGKTPLHTLTANLIIRTLDTNGSILKTPWVSANAFDIYSPFLWGTLALQPKPLLKIRWLIFCIAFIIGLALPLLFYGTMTILSKDRPHGKVYKRPVDDEKLFAKIKDAIEGGVTRSDLTLIEIGTALQMSPQKIETSLKKSTGMSFKKYIMYLRTEIVCERLRSSHSSEASIAETCGFKDINEMERFFEKYHHMTPYHFRQIQQVTQLLP